MEIKGQLERKLKPETGQSKAGKQWTKQEFIINTGAQYDPLVCITAFGEDKIEQLNKFSEGDDVVVSINLSSKEHEPSGRWFHNVNMWKIEGDASSVPAQAGPTNKGQNLTPEEDDEDIPF